MVEPKSGEILESRGFEFGNVQVLKKSANPDLALLKVIVPMNNQLFLPPPIKIIETCNQPSRQRLFSLGFSDTSLRNDPNSLPIENKEYVYKRWSEGIAVEEDKFNFKGVETNLLTTTIDALSGGSGGPVLNERGELVAVMKASASIYENGYKYDGNEDPNALDLTSMAVSCQEVKTFLDINELNTGNCD
jgi:hypothetical protein